MDTKVFRNLSYGVYIVTLWDEGRPTGCTANSIMQVTSSPASVAVSINHDNHTNECIKKLGKFAVSIMSETSDPLIIGRFGFFSGKDTDKFDGIDYSVKGYMPVINDSCGYMICEVTDCIETSTHTVFIANVTDGAPSAGEPMTYSYYHKEIKGKSPKNAPTYIAEE